MGREMNITTKYNIGDIVLAEVNKEYMGARDASIKYGGFALLECKVIRISINIRPSVESPIITYYVVTTNKDLHYGFSRVEGHLYPADTILEYYKKVIDMRQERSKLLKMTRSELVNYIERNYHDV
jgi:hypothetical protein